MTVGVCLEASGIRPRSSSTPNVLSQRAWKRSAEAKTAKESPQCKPLDNLQNDATPNLRPKTLNPNPVTNV